MHYSQPHQTPSRLFSAEYVIQSLSFLPVVSSLLSSSTVPHLGRLVESAYSDCALESRSEDGIGQVSRCLFVARWFGFIGGAETPIE